MDDARCDTQSVSHMQTWDVAIYAVGLDDKSSIWDGKELYSSAKQHQSDCTVVRNTDDTVAGDHNFKCEKVVASVIH